MADQLQGRILPGRTFGFEGDRNMPWYASETGHGTVMASMIARVSPMSKIYPIRLNTGAMIDVVSAARAIRAAVDRGATIISMSWTVTKPPEDLRKILVGALQYAIDKKVLLFCSNRDAGDGTDVIYYPAAWNQNSVIKIGAAQPSGLPYKWVGSLQNVDFILPGVEVVQRHSFRSSADVKKLTVETGSSVATALILYCVRINQMYGSGVRFGPADILELRNARTMVKAIQRFGMSNLDTDSTKNKFIEIWRKLDDKTAKISRANSKEKREIVAQLARDLHTPLAS